MRSINISRSRHRWLVGTAAALVLAACSACDSSGDEPASSIGLLGTVVTSADGAPNDALTIDSARVVGNNLVANVSHGGGCTDHRYQLVIGTAWMESFPVQVRARIAHNANGDNCRALLRRELSMDLLPLADAYRAAYKQPSGSVLIRLAGTTSTLLYVF